MALVVEYMLFYKRATVSYKTVYKIRLGAHFHGFVDLKTEGKERFRGVLDS